MDKNLISFLVHWTRYTHQSDMAAIQGIRLFRFLTWHSVPMVTGIVFLLTLGSCTGETTHSDIPASWDVQVGDALRAAQKVDSSARLFRVIAFPAKPHDSQWDYVNSPLTMEFYFDRLHGNDLRISFQDVAIADTLRVEELKFSTNTRTNNTSTSATQQTLSSVLGKAKLGPREAGLATWQDALTQATQRNMKLYPGFTLEVLKPTPTWQIGYSASSRSIFSVGHELAYEVDATTGVILVRDYRPSYLSP